MDYDKFIMPKIEITRFKRNGDDSCQLKPAREVK